MAKGDFISDEEMAKLDPTPKGFVSDEQMQQMEAQQPSQVESGLRGAAQGASLGFADEITGGVEAMWNAAKKGGMNMDEFLDTYTKARDESRANYKKAEEANPKTYMAGNIGGGVASALVPGLGGASIAKMGALGAAQGYGGSEATNLTDTAKDAGMGALLGGGIPAAGSAIVKGAQSLRPMVEKGASKVSSFLSGADEAAALRQIQRPTQVAAMEGEGAVRNLAQKAEQEIYNKGADLGGKVGSARDEFLQTSGTKAFAPEASALSNQIDEFLLANKPSPGGFSAISDAERQSLQEMRDQLSKGVSGEDLLKFRDQLDRVEGLASQYGQGKGSDLYTRQLKDSRATTADTLHGASPALKEADAAYSQYAKDADLLKSLKNDQTQESFINNIYGANKTNVQEAAGRTLAPDTFEAAKDIAANKEFRKIGPAGSESGMRNLIRVGGAVPSGGLTLAAMSPYLNKVALRGLGHTLNFTDDMVNKLAANPQIFGKYGPTLQEAIARGGSSLATTHYLMQQQDPEYQEMLRNLPQDETGDVK